MEFLVGKSLLLIFSIGTLAVGESDHTHSYVQTMFDSLNSFMYQLAFELHVDILPLLQRPL